MNKKDRFKMVRENRAPDCMPVWPRTMSQMIFGHGWLLPEVTGIDFLDVDRVTEAVMANIHFNDYDIAIPTYIDHAFAIPSLGGEIIIPDKFGIAAGPTDNKPVMKKKDWPKVKQILSSFDPWSTDPRMAGALKVLKNVAGEIRDSTPLVPHAYVGSAAAMHLFRPNEMFFSDMHEDPEWVDEMCRAASDFAIQWIRAQYQAGANSCTFLAEVTGTLMISPKMSERFNLENIARIARTVKTQFGQGTWLHIHGNFTRPKAYEYLERLAMETELEGFHFDESNPPQWIKEQVVDRFGVAACIITDGKVILEGPLERIRAEVREQISHIGDGLGIIMAPSCQLLPATSNKHFKAWVDATHEYGTYPLKN